MIDFSRRVILGGLAGLSLFVRAGAEEKPPSWLALGAPFRVADSGTVINGDTEKKLPIYDEVIPVVYQFADRAEVQRGLLAVVAHPRWFSGVGPAKPAKDIPLVDQGASLSFGITPLPEGYLQFNLELDAKERDVIFQSEHRRNDITPFLFAYSGDSVAAHAAPYRGGISGGVQSLSVLVKKGERGSWSFKVDTKSVLALFAERKVSELSVVAAFSELRQEYGLGETSHVIEGTGVTSAFIEGIGEVPVISDGRTPTFYGEDGKETEWKHRPILIGSKPLVLGYADGKWSVKEVAGK